MNCPTSIVFDLDPGKPAGILECGEVALHLKKVFEGLGLETFVKVSARKDCISRGTAEYSGHLRGDAAVREAIAELVTQQLPDRAVSEMAKTLRRGKIDWSQNSDFKTTVCVYAMRAKREEPFISMPITWQELARAEAT